MTVPNQQPTPLKPRHGLRFCLCFIAAASAVACIVMPVLGVQRVFEEFRVPYSARVHAEILIKQTVGPVYTLLVVLPCAVLSLVSKKRIPWWLWLLGVLGPVYTVSRAQMVAHEFSHTLFRECSDVYGAWISGICVIGGSALIALTGIALRERRREKAEI